MSKKIALCVALAAAASAAMWTSIMPPVTAKTALPQMSLCDIAKEKVGGIKDEVSFKDFLVAIGISEAVAASEARNVVHVDHTPWIDVKTEIQGHVAADCN